MTPLATIRRLVTALVLATAPAGEAATAAAPSGPPIQDLRPIALHDGVNVVPGFLPGGRPVTVVQAWRANGNAHGHHDWLVLGPAAEGHGAAEVTVNDPATDGLVDLIGDAPFDGERVIGEVVFARGRLHGRTVALLLRADLNQTPDRPMADHETATVRIFRIVKTDGEPGDSPYEFRPAWSLTTTKRYCNAQLALSQVLHMPLPRGYAGPNRAGGCF